MEKEDKINNLALGFCILLTASYIVHFVGHPQNLSTFGKVEVF